MFFSSTVLKCLSVLLGRLTALLEFQNLLPLAQEYGHAFLPPAGFFLNDIFIYKMQISKSIWDHMQIRGLLDTAIHSHCLAATEKSASLFWHYS